MQKIKYQYKNCLGLVNPKIFIQISCVKLFYTALANKTRTLQTCTL